MRSQKQAIVFGFLCMSFFVYLFITNMSKYTELCVATLQSALSGDDRDFGLLIIMYGCEDDARLTRLYVHLLGMIEPLNDEQEQLVSSVVPEYYKRHITSCITVDDYGRVGRKLLSEIKKRLVPTSSSQ